MLVIYFGLSHGASYQKTYGAFAGALMFMLWLWITNVAMLFGAEVDAELIRTRQLKSGLPAEELILLPPKDDQTWRKQDLKAADEYDTAHELRLDSMRDAAGDRNIYGRPALLAGHAAQLVGDASTAGRSGKAGLVGPRDASVPRPADDNRGEDAVAHDLEAEAAAIEESRLRRRDDFLLKAGKARIVRDRLDRQRAKAERKRKEREQEIERKRKIEQSYITRQERWAAVAKVRAEYDPPETPERDEIYAERRARRAAYDAEQAEKAAKPTHTPRQPADPEPKHQHSDPAPSELRAHVERQQQNRRELWFGTHPRRTAR